MDLHSSGIAKMAIYYVIVTFAASYDFWHDFTVKATSTFYVEPYQSDICRLELGLCRPYTWL